LLGQWAAGRFYYDYIWQGVLKLLLGLWVCYGQLVFKIALTGQRGDAGGFALAFLCCMCLSALGVLAWWITDIVMIATYDLTPQSDCIDKNL